MNLSFDWPADASYDEPDPATTPPPEPTRALCLLTDEPACGICGEPIPARSVAWLDDPDDWADPTIYPWSHPGCAAGELAASSDPYGFYGVRRSDF